MIAMASHACVKCDTHYRPTLKIEYTCVLYPRGIICKFIPKMDSQSNDTSDEDRSTSARPDIQRWINTNKHRVKVAEIPCIICGVDDQMFDENNCSDCDEARVEYLDNGGDDYEKGYYMAGCDSCTSGLCGQCYENPEGVYPYIRILYELLGNDDLQDEDVVGKESGRPRQSKRMARFGLTSRQVYKKLLAMHMSWAYWQDDSKHCSHKVCGGVHPKLDRFKELEGRLRAKLG
jgi:hypothetical protein